MKTNELAKSIEKEFRLSITKITKMHESADNIVYEIATDNKQDYIARMSKRDILSDVNFETTWLRYLDKEGVVVPNVIDNQFDKTYITANKKTIVLFLKAKGKQITFDKNNKPNITKVGNSAKVLAKIHNHSYNKYANLLRNRNIFTEIDRVLEIKDRIIQNCVDGEQFVSDLNSYKVWAKVATNNKYLIHNDYHPGNILFKGNIVSTVVDFDWSCKGPAIKDVAHASVLWSFPDGAEAYWTDVFYSFIEKYNGTAIHKIMIDGDFYNWVCFSCLSDTATYIADLADTKVYKPISGSYMYKKFLYFKNYLPSNIT